MRSSKAAVAAGVAHALSWIAMLWLLLWPSMYTGVTVTSEGQQAETTASLIEVNGWGVLPILLIPVALTGLGLAVTLLRDLSPGVRKALVWTDTVVLLGFCVVALLSIGMFYAPAALALIVAAVLATRTPQAPSPAPYPESGG